MGYGQYLMDLLEPLGVYSFAAGGLGRAEVEALGVGLDTVEALLERTEREALPATAEDEGLDRWAAVYARQPIQASLQLRREALMALARIGEGDFTLRTINGALAGCGVRAEVQELASRGHIRVIFPEVGGIPEEFDQIEKIILDILPCHLEVEFYFRYQTWEECEKAGWTWERIETGEHTWESFEMAI